jgi:hypothetical protein
MAIFARLLSGTPTDLALLSLWLLAQPPSAGEHLFYAPDRSAPQRSAARPAPPDPLIFNIDREIIHDLQSRRAQKRAAVRLA